MRNFYVLRCDLSGAPRQDDAAEAAHVKRRIGAARKKHVEKHVVWAMRLPHHPLTTPHHRVIFPPARLAAPLVASLTDSQAHALVDEDWTALSALLPARAHNLITYSRKVFIPLTRLCRDSCGYCTFAHHRGLPPGTKAYLTPEEVLEIAAAGKATGCTEALFTLGDRPEARWPAAREHLAQLGHGSTIEYVVRMA